MKTPDKIKKKKQQISRLEHNHALEQIQKRKKDTRRKIQLGGLVIKAGMDRYPKEVVLGALLYSKKCLELDSLQERIFSEMGFEVFR